MTSEETLRHFELALQDFKHGVGVGADDMRSLIADSRLLRELREKLPKCVSQACNAASLRAELNSLRASNARLIEALRPFAKHSTDRSHKNCICMWCDAARVLREVSEQ